MSAVVHQLHGTPTSRLEELTAEIYASIDRMVMRVGAALDEALRTHPADYERWVVEDLPFGLDTARRLRAIFVAYRELPVDTLAQMPKPWQALFALRHMPRPAIEAAVAAGTLTPSTSVRQAQVIGRPWSPHSTARTPAAPTVSRADLVAARLVTLPVTDVSPATRAALERWLKDA